MVAAVWFWMTIHLPFLEFGLGYVGYFRKTFIVFAKYNHEIHFLMDLLKDPILSSVIPMVTPTRCHRATGGNPF